MKTKEARAENPEKRVRVAFDASSEVAEQARALAASRGVPLAHVALEALQTLLAAEKAKTQAVQFAPRVRESEKARQTRFLEAIEEEGGIAAASRLTEIPRKTVKQWMTDPNFVDRYLDSKAAYAESVEVDLLKLGRGVTKGQVLALITWLNANSPQYGRVRIETIARRMETFIDKCYGLIRADLGEKTGEAIVKKLREEADLQLSGLTP